MENGCFLRKNQAIERRVTDGGLVYFSGDLRLVVRS